MRNIVEPEEAFPYRPPTDLVKKKYGHLFEIQETLRPRIAKLFFDKIVSFFLVVFSAPVLLLLKVA